MNSTKTKRILLNLFKHFRKQKEPAPAGKPQIAFSPSSPNVPQLNEKMAEFARMILDSEPKACREALLYASIALTIHIIVDEGRMSELYYKMSEMFPEYDYADK